MDGFPIDGRGMLRAVILQGHALGLFPRVSFSDGETEEEHEDGEQAAEGDEEDVGGACRQDFLVQALLVGVSGNQLRRAG